MSLQDAEKRLIKFDHMYNRFDTVCDNPLIRPWLLVHIAYHYIIMTKEPRGPFHTVTDLLRMRRVPCSLTGTSRR